MKYQRGIWIPDSESWPRWSAKYEQKCYRELNLTGNVCLDIGAHVGIWSKRLSKDFSKVICFEPLSKHIECHKENCKELNNVFLYEYALSDIETDAIMTTKDRNSGMSSLEQKKFRNKKEEVVKTKTLDSFKFEKIDFMKIDVEGYEEHALMGAKKTILEYSPKIFIEIWGVKFEKVSQLISSMGYNTMKKVGYDNYFYTKEL
tara:strand:- start:1029 stop:1637 length:609 start_codon:yes stop_codon:yes gene_type:complete